MGKKSKKLSNKELPFVSVCTPTYNRRPFIPNMLKCFKHQDYPMDKIEWIILDDGSDPIEDLILEANLPQIKYIKLKDKLPLGKKRNMLHENSKGDFIVYMDDDDYYPPCRVSHAVDMLLKHPKALCAGSSEIYIYFKHINQMIQFGPYGPNHATAGTFAFRRELLKEHKYEDHAALAEEKAFLKNYTVPFVQLEPKKVILVFSHIHNTFDKKKLLDSPHPNFVKTIWQGDLELPPGRPAGQQINVKFSYDENSIIHCEFEDDETKQITEVDIDAKSTSEEESEIDKFLVD